MRTVGGRPEAVIKGDGVLRGRKGEGQNLAGKLELQASVDVASGQVVTASTRIDVDLDLTEDGGSSGLASGVYPVSLRRAPTPRPQETVDPTRCLTAGPAYRRETKADLVSRQYAGPPSFGKPEHVQGRTHHPGERHEGERLVQIYVVRLEWRRVWTSHPAGWRRRFPTALCRTAGVSRLGPA